MSQAKVEQYKEDKKNRKQMIAKEKRKKKFWKIFGPVLTILVIAAIGACVYFLPKLTDNAKANNASDQIDNQALIDAINAAAAQSSTDTSDDNTATAGDTADDAATATDTEADTENVTDTTVDATEE